MATIPLIRNKNDLYYRYQMPKLIAKIEGSGNGIRTVVTNMTLIAKAINRPATYVTKFFGYELGAQVKTEASIYSVNGAHDSEKLLSLLYSFIEKFVLCSNCENPETDLSVVKKTISLKCKACGHITTITESKHKLTTFIINHPITSTTTTSTTSGDTKSGGKSKKTKKSEDGTTNTTTTTKGKKSGHKNDSGDNTHTNNAGTTGGDDDDFEDNGDFSGEDLKPDPTITSLVDEFKTAKIDTNDMCEKFYQSIKQKIDTNQITDIKVHKELLTEAETLGIRDKATIVLSKALFDEHIIEQISKHQKLLLRFCYNNHKAQKYLLGGIEKTFETYSKLITNTAKILKEFYDQDILDEEILIDWYEKISKKYVSKELAKTIREKAFPLIKWLKEAEVEDDSGDEKSKTTNNNGNNKQQQSGGHNNNTNNDNKNVNGSGDDDEDEDDDDIDIEYSHRVSGLKVEAVKDKKVDDELDDELIDAI